MNFFLLLSCLLSVVSATGAARREMSMNETILYMRKLVNTTPVLDISEFTKYLQRAIKFGNCEYLDLICFFRDYLNFTLHPQELIIRLFLFTLKMNKRVVMH